jgi:orotate phosphoribosyltransferase
VVIFRWNIYIQNKTTKVYSLQYNKISKAFSHHITGIVISLATKGIANSTMVSEVLITLNRHTRSICDAESLEDEMEHLKKAFRQNGYSNGKKNRALYPRHKQQQQ